MDGRQFYDWDSFSIMSVEIGKLDSSYVLPCGAVFPIRIVKVPTMLALDSLFRGKEKLI
jgi:hypothetical protein